MNATDGGGQLEAVFEELFRTAYVVAYRILGNVAEAEDAAAEAIARACHRWSRIGPLVHRQAWVARVAANIAIDVTRTRRRASATAPGSVEDLTARDPGEAAVLRLALVAALTRLSSRQREVVVLRYLADQPEAEVASLLGISTNTVKKHTLRGVAALRQGLGTTWEDVDVGWT